MAEHLSDEQAIAEYLTVSGKGTNLDANGGYLQMRWINEDGSTEWRNYNLNGKRNEGDFSSTASDAQNSLAWLDTNGDQVIDSQDPAFAALRLWTDVHSVAQEDGSTTTTTTIADGIGIQSEQQTLSDAGISAIRITRHLLTLGPAQTSNTMLDLDADGYLEQTQWTISPLLAVDLDGNGILTGSELVSSNASGVARLGWLDANGITNTGTTRKVDADGTLCKSANGEWRMVA